MSLKIVPKSPRRIEHVFQNIPSNHATFQPILTSNSAAINVATERTQLVLPALSDKYSSTKTPVSIPSLPSLEEIETKPIAKEITTLLSRSWLISLQQLCAVISALITISFIGQIKGENSAQLIAGVGLAASFTNVLSVAVCTGLTIALGTLLPQCIGAGHTHLTKIHVQRAWYLISILAIFLCAIQFFAGDIMVAIGQPKELRIIVNAYCRILIPSTFLEVIFLVLNSLIQSLDMNKYLFYSNVVAVILFVPILYVLIYFSSLGYLGGAVAVVMYAVFNVCGQIFILYQTGYSYIFKPLPLSVIFRWKGCVTYIKLALPGVFQESFEWIILELAVLLSGYVSNPATAISATVIIQQIDLFIFSFSYGCAQATAIRVAEYIGVGSIEYAQRAAKIGTALVSGISIIFIVILLLTRKYIGSVWTYNEDVINEVADLIYVYVIFELSDTNKQTMTGIYRGLGFQHQSAIFVFITYLLICLPLMIILLFWVGLRDNVTTGLYTIWAGLTFGNVLSFSVITLWIFCGCVNWNRSVVDAKARFEEANKNLKLKNYRSISSSKVLLKTNMFVFAHVYIFKHCGEL
eukprot:477425_1